MRETKFRSQDLTLDDTIWLMDWLESREFNGKDLARLKRILLETTDLTEDEIGKAKLSELPQLFKIITQGKEAEAAAAVNPPTGSSSESGPAGQGSESPSG